MTHTDIRPVRILAKDTCGDGILHVQRIILLVSIFLVFLFSMLSCLKLYPSKCACDYWGAISKSNEFKIYSLIISSYANWKNRLKRLFIVFLLLLTQNSAELLKISRPSVGKSLQRFYPRRNSVLAKTFAKIRFRWGFLASFGTLCSSYAALRSAM